MSVQSGTGTPNDANRGQGVPRIVENGDWGASVKSASSMFVTFMNITNTITQLVLGAVAFSAFFIANLNPQTTSFKQHIYLCVSGYIILMSQAILSLNPHAGWTNTFKLQQKRAIHWIMQIAGSILAITGSAIRITDIQNHLETPHGILGVCAFLFTILSLIGGVINLFSARMGIKPVLVKIIHSCFGTLTLVLAFLSLIFALDKDFVRQLIGDINSNLAIAFAVVAVAGTILSPIFTMSRRMFC